jgi:hypothetical protein
MAPAASPAVEARSGRAPVSRRLLAHGLVVLTSLLVLFLGSVVLDRVAGLLTPANPARVAHPPNFYERRHTSEFTTDFRTNSHGLRYGELSPTKTSPNEFRAFVAGDSMTEGWGVESEQTFSALLERSLSVPGRPTHFINGGLSGTGPVEYGRLVAVVGLEYHPDLVLLVLHPNDVTDTPLDADLDLARDRHGKYVVWSSKPSWPPGGLIHKAAYALWPWSYVRLQRAAKHQDIVQLEQRLGLMERVRIKARASGISDDRIRAWFDHLPAGVIEATDRGEVRQDLVANGLLFPDDLVQQLDLPGEMGNRRWASVRRTLDAIVGLCRAEHVRIGVVYTSTAAQYDEAIGTLRRQVGGQMRREWLTGEAEVERRLAGWAAESNVPLLSLTSAFRTAAHGEPATFNYPLDEHWTPAGHRLAAHEISAWLVEQHLVSRPPDAPRQTSVR